MHRPLLRAPLWSIADTLCKSKFHQHVEGPRNVAGKLEFCRPLTTSLGHEILGYGEGSSTNLLQTKIVDALRLGERSRASHLLSNLGHGSHSVRADDFVYILRYCATTPDALFVMETWRIMEEKEIGLNNTCYLLMMRALCKGGHLEEASNLIKFTGESHGIYPTLPVYNCFLGACAKMQSMTHADLCLELMESRRVGKDETTYIQLLKIAAWQQNLSAVHEIWKEYIKHYSPSIFPLRMFIWSLAKLRDLKSAYETLQHMVSFSLSTKPYITAKSKGMLYSSKLDIPIPSNDLLSSRKLYLDESEDAVVLSADTCVRNIEQSISSNMGIGEAGSSKLVMMNKFQTMPSMKILGWAFKDVMHACEQTQDGGLAEQLMLQMQNLGLQPSAHTYNCYVRAVVSERGFSIGIDLLKKMQQMNLKPYDFTLAIVSIECSKALELDYAEALLDHITKCSNTRPFNVFLAACDTMDQPERAVKMLDKMKRLNLKPDIRTYELLFSLFGNVNAPYEEGNMLSQVDSAKRINAIERNMAKNGVQHSYKSMNYLLKSLGAEGMIREQLQYLRMADNQFLHKDNYCETPIYNTVLHSLVKAGESNTAIEIFKNMKLFGLSPNAATYHIMIDCCVIIRCFKSACAIVSMMVRSGFYPETMAYTILFKVLLECEDFDEALNMFDRVSSEGIQLDILSYNTILQQAWLKGRIDVIEFIIEQMHQQKIQPDPSTCHYVFTGYVDRGFHSTAIEALQVLSMRMLSEEEDTLQEKKTKFEDLILTEDSEPESKILQLFKDSENLGSALLNLRWCALAGYSISWSPDQSPWARRLSTNYNTRERTARLI
ncbi:hypothetical protein QYF36_008673 [Acer negundo]|nr:hypothetical protein QYF36_008673 [Acer negundo]